MSKKSVASKSEQYVPNADESSFWIHSVRADLVFGGCILFHAIVLAIETDAVHDSHNDQTWLVIDSIFNIIFIAELILHMYAERCKWCRHSWNLFDCFLVLVGVADTWILPLVSSKMFNMGFMPTLRILRLLRLLRIVRIFRLCKELNLMLMGVASAMRAMIWGLLLLGITIFLCAIVITRLVGKSDTFTNPLYFELFGTMFRTSFTLLQFTMEFQPDLCRSTWNDGAGLTTFLIVYTCFTNVTLLNIIASTIVDSILTVSRKMHEEAEAKQEAAADAAQRARLKDAFLSADRNSDGVLELEELGSGEPHMLRALEIVGVGLNDAEELFMTLDVDKSGHVSMEEFTEGLIRVRKPPQSKHLLQIERRLACIDLKVTQSVEELLSLLREAQKPIDYQESNPHKDAIKSVALQCCDNQHKDAHTSEMPEFCAALHETRDELLTVLQGELLSCRRSLTLHMEAYHSKLQGLKVHRDSEVASHHDIQPMFKAHFETTHSLRQSLPVSVWL